MKIVLVIVLCSGCAAPARIDWRIERAAELATADEFETARISAADVIEYQAQWQPH